MDTMIWSLILLITAGITIGCLIGIRHMKSVALRRGVFLAATALILVPGILLSLKYPLNAGVILLHLTGYLIGALLVDGIIDLIIKKRTEKKETEPRAKRRARIAAAAMVGCLIYLIAGYINAGWIRRTAYTMNTDKAIAGGHLRIAQLSDVHLGTTLDSKKFEDLLVRISGENADILVVTGDLVDENTSQDEMLRCCAAFSEKCTIDVIFYVAGNHDVYEGMAFTEEELFEALKANGVTVLRDDVVLMPNGYYVAGRKDASEIRKSMQELLEEVDPTKYTIVLDHQPNDFDDEGIYGADLVLAGHTHGGYLFPMRLAAPLLTGFFGDSDRIAGREIRNNSLFIVSSGAGTWGCSFKTGAISEYVIIDISSEKMISDETSTKSSEEDPFGSEIQKEDFEEHEYILSDEDTRKFIYTAKNNSAMTVGIDGYLILYTLDGEIYDALRNEISILAPGEESIMVFDLSEYEEKYSLEFRAEYDPFPYEKPVINNLKIEMITNPNATKEKLSAIIKNTGGSFAEFVDMYVLYFSSGEIVGCEKKGLPNLKPDASVAVAFSTEKAYDETRYYLTGYSSVFQPSVTDPVSKDDFAIKQYTFENADRKSYYLRVKNNGDKTAKVNGILIALDERGYMIAARNSKKTDNVLRSGEETLLMFDLPGDFAIGSVGYDLSFDTELAPEQLFGQGELDVERKIDGNIVTVTVTNRSYSFPRFFSMTALFLDRSGNVVWADEATVSDESYMFADPYGQGYFYSDGSAITRQFFSPVPFDSVEVFCNSTNWMMSAREGTPQAVAVRDDEFETKGYLLRTNEGAEYIFLVKNNSGTTVAVTGSAIALDASGHVLAQVNGDTPKLTLEDGSIINISDLSDLWYDIGDRYYYGIFSHDEKIEALHPGETGLIRFVFPELNESEIDRVVCPLMFDTKEKENHVNTAIRAETVVQNGETLTVKAFNEGAYECQSGDLYALYFDQDDKLIAYDRKGLLRHTNTIQPTGEVNGVNLRSLSAGAATTLKLTCPESFDHVEFYTKSISYAEDNALFRSVAEGDFTLKEYRGTGDSNDNLYFLAIRNNMDGAADVNALVTAYDSEENVIGVDSSILSTLGSDEEYIMCFNLRTEGPVDHVDYELRTNLETEHHSAKDELTIEENIRPDGVEITASNKGVLRLGNVYGTVLFLDPAGRVVYCAENSLKQNFANYLEPGETQTTIFECPTAFDKALIYIKCIY
ncbi:MAG: metallophosphoesterase [Lachnospiraceae bacterium]|nr:metallophosphoesterase [Lachnospiraceae bacterium]